MGMSKEIIGFFVAATRGGCKRTVIVSQEKTATYSKEKTFMERFFNLESIDGPEVFKTEDPRVFRLFDGTELLKRGNAQQNVRQFRPSRKKPHAGGG